MTGETCRSRFRGGPAGVQFRTAWSRNRVRTLARRSAVQRITQKITCCLAQSLRFAALHDPHVAAGPPIRLARIHEVPRVHGHRDRDARTRDWRQQRDFHRGQRGDHAAVAVRAAGSTRPGHRRFCRDQRLRYRDVAARAGGLSRPFRPVRRHRRRLGHQREPDRGRRAGACGSAAGESVLLRRARRPSATWTPVRPGGQRSGYHRGRGHQRQAVAPSVRRLTAGHWSQAADR